VNIIQNFMNLMHNLAARMNQYELKHNSYFLYPQLSHHLRCKNVTK
jgi:hypothetical protein